LANPSIKPDIKGMFANPEQAGKTVNQIGEALQKKFKGKPMGEAIGRFLGNVHIAPRGNGAQGDAEAPPSQKRSGKGASQAKPPPGAGETDQGDSDDADDPDLDRILR